MGTKLRNENFERYKIAVLIIACLAVIACIIYLTSVFDARSQRVEVRNMIFEITNRGATMTLTRGNSTGYAALSKNGEAFCSVVNNGRSEAEAYLKNDYCVSFDSKLTTSRCVNPIKFIDRLIVSDKIKTIERKDADTITGSELDHDKSAYIAVIKGLDDCLSALDTCTAQGAEALLSYGVKESDYVSIWIYAYRGVSVYTDETCTSRKIIDDDVYGCCTFQVELVVEREEKRSSHMIMSLATRSVGVDFVLGDKIYKCTPETYETLSSDDISNILDETAQAIEKSLEQIK